MAGTQIIGAFFKIGPSLITRDVPATYNPQNPLTPDSWLSHEQQASQTQGAGSQNTAAIRLPIGGATKKGTWNWLQPYLGATADDERRYNALDVGPEG